MKSGLIRKQVKPGQLILLCVLTVVYAVVLLKALPKVPLNQGY